jgi:hypothetical protein
VRVRLVDDFTIQVELADQDTVCFDCPPSRKVRHVVNDQVASADNADAVAFVSELPQVLVMIDQWV